MSDSIALSDRATPYPKPLDEMWDSKFPTPISIILITCFPLSNSIKSPKNTRFFRNSVELSHDFSQFHGKQRHLAPVFRPFLERPNRISQRTRTPRAPRRILGEGLWLEEGGAHGVHEAARPAVDDVAHHGGDLRWRGKSEKICHGGMGQMGDGRYFMHLQMEAPRTTKGHMLWGYSLA